MKEPQGLISIQNVRLLDVFVIAPFLFYVSMNEKLDKNTRIGLGLLAVGTLVYNGYNYLREAKNTN